MILRECSRYSPIGPKQMTWIRVVFVKLSLDKPSLNLPYQNIVSELKCYNEVRYIYLIEETLTLKSLSHGRCDPNYLQIGKRINRRLRQNKHNKTGCINRAFKALKAAKENILIINKMNITKLTKAAYPESLWVISFMVYAFHGVKISSIRCIFKHN